MLLRSTSLCCQALVAFASGASAQTVEFRIVERSGQTSWSSANPVLNFAIQARVVGASGDAGIGNFGFDVVAPGEPDGNGTLFRLLISNTDGTYAPNPANANNGSVGRGGLAAQYTYLAGISATFNGLVNLSGGSFTNDPNQQEIGLITGSPTGASLLLQADLNGDGNPDTYPGTGDTAPIDPAYANTYLGANGNWIDVYRFKYTITNYQARNLTFTLASVSAQLATGWQFTNSVWGPVQSAPQGVTVSPIVFPIPAPATGPVLASALLLVARRRR